MKKYTKSDLADLPTLSVGQTCNLKIEKPGLRVWLARTTVEDGEPYNNKVTIERLDENGCWYTAQEYKG